MLEHQVHERFSGLTKTARTALQLARQTAFTKYRRASERLRESEKVYNAQALVHTGNRGLLVEKRGIVEHHAAAETFTSKPACPVCSVPLDRIFEEGCPCSTIDADLGLIQQRHVQAVEDLRMAVAAEAGSKEQLWHLSQSVLQAKDAEESAAQALQTAEVEGNVAMSGSEEGSRLLDTIETVRGLILDRESAPGSDRGGWTEGTRPDQSTEESAG